MPSLRCCVFLGAAMVLAGCQGMAARDPLASAPGDLPAACHWVRNDDASRERWLRAAVDALEERDYVITNTEVELGVVSAERRSRLPGLGAVERPWFGFGSFWGSLGSSSGISVGYGMHFREDPVEIERVSVVVDETEATITRDSSVVDPDGYLIDARPENRPEFCRELSAAIESRLIVEDSLP